MIKKLEKKAIKSWKVRKRVIKRNIKKEVKKDMKKTNFQKMLRLRGPKLQLRKNQIKAKNQTNSQKKVKN